MNRKFPTLNDTILTFSNSFAKVRPRMSSTTSDHLDERCDCFEASIRSVMEAGEEDS